MSSEIALREERLPGLAGGNEPPAIVADAGDAAKFAWDEFFEGELPNRHTRTAYQRAIRTFLAWCQNRDLELHRITPGLVGQYFARHPGSIPTKKQHLAAIRQFFNRLVLRHVIVLNPADSVACELVAVAAR